MCFLRVGECFHLALWEQAPIARGQILEPQHHAALQNEGHDRTLQERASQEQWPYDDASFLWVHGDDGVGSRVRL
jgi:hypothetical protein